MNRYGFRKSIIIVAFFALLLGPVAPVAVPRAHAIFGVGDVSITIGDIPRILEQVLKRAAIVAAKQAIQSVTRSTVNWIRSGFDGSPAFATNLGVNVRQLSDAVASDFLNQLITEAQIKSPFLNELIGDVGLAYYAATDPDSFGDRLAYTLTRYSPNDRAFLAGDFSQGGYNAWMSAFRYCGNNPYCARYSLEEELSNRLRAAGEQRLQELGWGRGFLSWRGECIKMDDPTVEVPLGDEEGCVEYSIKTPGSVIESQLEEALGSSLRELQVADSIDQIVGALASQLITQVISGEGLAGGNSSSGTRPPLGGTNTSSVVTLSEAFLQNVTAMREQVVNYRDAWQRIQSVAVAAQQACSNNSDALQNVVLPAVTQANTALQKASTALAALDSIQSRANAVRAGAAAGSNEAGTFAAVQNEYQTLLSGSTFPTGAELTYALTESQDSTDPETLYTRLVRIGDDGGVCE